MWVIRRISIILQPNCKGEMLEWLKRHAWKACILQKGIPSSNLGLSAKMPSTVVWEAFLYKISQIVSRKQILLSI